jgi:hypothetical protein
MLVSEPRTGTYDVYGQPVGYVMFAGGVGLHVYMVDCALVEKPCSVRPALLTHVAVYVVEPMVNVLEPKEVATQPEVDCDAVGRPPT